MFGIGSENSIIATFYELCASYPILKQIKMDNLIVDFLRHRKTDSNPTDYKISQPILNTITKSKDNNRK